MKDQNEIADEKGFMREVAEVMKTASELGEEYTKVAAENEQLKTKVAELEADGTEKQASGESAPAFNDDRLDQAVDIIISAGVAKEASRDELLKDLQDDPNKVLDLVEKLAGADKAAEEAPSFGNVSKEKTANADAPATESESFWSRRFRK